MVDELLPDIYRIELPLPRNPLRVINAYLVKGPERSLLIDTGMNRPECIEAMREAIAALALDLGRTDILATHAHSDHIGLVSWLRTDSSRIFLSPADEAVICDPNLWTDMAAAARAHGFPDADAAVLKHPGKKYLFAGQPDFTPLREGECLSVGRYRLRCVETPGHTPGHLCLYEPEARLLFSGDHILDSITPNISAWAQEQDPLGDFLASLDKVAAYDIALVLPGHRRPIPDPSRRIAELKAHHRARMAEVLEILARGPRTAYQVAAEMRWSISYARWEEFPAPQQWFATGEALAHLLHLERSGRVARGQRDGVACFAV
jgi:glyoxylase-like metal-dependent hydrolase (beta-lactamase superfamily II)